MSFFPYAKESEGIRQRANVARQEELYGTTYRMSNGFAKKSRDRSNPIADRYVAAGAGQLHMRPVNLFALSLSIARSNAMSCRCISAGRVRVYLSFRLRSDSALFRLRFTPISHPSITPQHITDNTSITGEEKRRYVPEHTYLRVQPVACRRPPLTPVVLVSCWCRAGVIVAGLAANSLVFSPFGGLPGICPEVEPGIGYPLL